MNTKCYRCGFEDKRNFCPNCGAPLSELPDIADSVDNLEGAWTDKCPVCRASPLKPVLERTLLDAVKPTTKHKCSNCDAFFVLYDGKYKLVRVRDKSAQIWRDYGGKSLTGEEWKRIASGGMSDIKMREAKIKEMLTDLTEREI